MRLTKALIKYSVPAATRIKVGNAEIWPPKIPIEGMQTETVLTSGRKGEIKDRRINTEGKFRIHTEWAQNLARSKSTQVAGFATKEKMSAFVKEVYE